MTNPETVRKRAYGTIQPVFWKVFLYALVYVLGAVFFTGLLIATVTNIWRARSDKFRRGAVSYGFEKHIVFLGYNSLIAGMIQKICEEEEPKHVRIVVGVENNASSVSDEIKNRLYEKYRSYVVVLQADSCNMEDLERLRVPYAKEVYIIGEHDDTYNLKCYRTIYEVSLCERSKKTRMPKCYVNLQSQATLTLFRTYASTGELGIDFSKFHSFSFYDEWSKMIVKEMIENSWAGNENYQDHFFIGGMTEMGIALARRIALLFQKPDPNNHTIITLIDENAASKSRHFIIQNQVFFEHCRYSVLTKEGKQTPPKINGNKQSDIDIEFEFIEGNLSENSIRGTISKSQQDSHQKTTIALCYEDPLLNLTMGLNLPDYEEEGDTRVWVYQPTLGDLGKYLKNSLYKRVITFGMLGEHLDIRNKENSCIPMLINHYFRHQDGKTNYANRYLVETEWDGTSISDRWACIRRADFIPVIARYNDNNEDELKKMKDMEAKRTMVDNLLFSTKKKNKKNKENSYLYLKDYSKYIKAIKQDIPRNIFV